MPQSSLEIEIEKNFRFFQSQLPHLLKSNHGRFAVLKAEKIHGIYDTLRDAKLVGDSSFSDGIFSIQKIEEGAVNLGFFSYAVHLGEPQ